MLTDSPKNGKQVVDPKLVVDERKSPGETAAESMLDDLSESVNWRFWELKVVNNGF